MSDDKKTRRVDVKVNFSGIVPPPAPPRPTMAQTRRRLVEEAVQMLFDDEDVVAAVEAGAVLNLLEQPLCYTAASVLSAWGISLLQRTRQVDADDLLLELSERFARIPDVEEAGSIAMAFFGDVGGHLLPLLRLGREAVEMFLAGLRDRRVAENCRWALSRPSASAERFTAGFFDPALDPAFLHFSRISRRVTALETDVAALRADLCDVAGMLVATATKLAREASRS